MVHFVRQKESIVDHSHREQDNLQCSSHRNMYNVQIYIIKL